MSLSSACVLRPIDLRHFTSTEQVPRLPIPLQRIPGQIPHFKSRFNFDHCRLEICDGGYKASRYDDVVGDRFRTCRERNNYRRLLLPVVMTKYRLRKGFLFDLKCDLDKAMKLVFLSEIEGFRSLDSHFGHLGKSFLGMISSSIVRH